MSKSETIKQTSIFDAISLCEIKKNVLKVSKRCYQLAFLKLTKLFVNNKLSTDEYKEYLHALCENYRKDYKKDV